MYICQAREKIIKKIGKTIEMRRRQPVSEVDSGVLGRLLEEESLVDDTIADFIINLVFAGNETTAKTMMFAVYFLSQCPRALQELIVREQNISNRCLSLFLGLMTVFV